MKFSKRLYQNFSWRLAYYVSLFLLNIGIAQYFHAAPSGWLNYLVSICSLLILIGGFSLDAAIGYHISKGTFTSHNISGFILSWSIITAFIATPVSLLIFSPEHFSDTSAPVLLGIAFFIAGNSLISMLQALFYARHNFRLPGIVTVLGNLSLLLFLMACSYFKWELDIMYFFMQYGIAVLAQGLLLWIALIIKDKMRTSPGSYYPGAIKALFRFASVVFLGNLIFFLVYRIDYWFVNKYCDGDLLGNYIQVSKLVQLFLIIPAGMASVIFPAVAAGKMEMTGKLKSLSRVMVSSFAIVLLILALTGKWLFGFMFGPGFDKMYEPFLLLIPGIICLAMISLLGAYFGGKNMARVNLTGAVIALCLTIAGDIILIPLLDIRGAAIASSISYAGYLCYLLFLFHKKEASGIGDFFLCTKNDIRFIWSFFMNRQS